jgi:outer membrane protein TolC
MEEALIIGLLFNPELQQARLKAQVPFIEKENYRYLPNPNLGLEFEPATIEEATSTKKELLLFSRLGFTFPLSFIAATYLDTLDKESEYQAYQILEAEHDVEKQIIALWMDCFSSKQKIIALEKHIDHLNNLIERIELSNISSVALQSLVIDVAEHEAERLELKSIYETSFKELTNTLGLKFDLMYFFDFELPVNQLNLLDKPWKEVLVNNNLKIQMAKAHYQVMEYNLKLEVKKQYPNLTLSPLHVEDQSHLGLGMSLLLPIFDRNQKGIELAAMNREVAYSQVESMYQQQVNAYIHLESLFKQINQRESYYLEKLSPLIEQQFQNVLGNISGEGSNLLMLKDVLTKQLDSKLEMIDILSEKHKTIYLINDMFKPITLKRVLSEIKPVDGE